jgi:hypothetical protein
MQLLSIDTNLLFAYEFYAAMQNPCGIYNIYENFIRNRFPISIDTNQWHK